jgi:hypothetical protein
MMGEINYATYYHPCMNVDPHGNYNNHDAILITRAQWRANAKLLALQNKTLAKIKAAADEAFAALMPRPER